MLLPKYGLDKHANKKITNDISGSMLANGKRSTKPINNSFLQSNNQSTRINLNIEFWEKGDYWTRHDMKKEKKKQLEYT